MIWLDGWPIRGEGEAVTSGGMMDGERCDELAAPCECKCPLYSLAALEAVERAVI